MQPIPKLPISSLVSKENDTNKSTFANFLVTMFAANVAIVGNHDINGNFNARWANALKRKRALSTSRKFLCTRTNEASSE
jgi:hypothetical protein